MDTTRLEQQLQQDTAIKYARALALRGLHRNEEALAELRQILQMDPRYHQAHVRIWEIMQAEGRLDNATALLKRRLLALETHAEDVPRAENVQIADTTLCCIDCSNHALAERALRLSMRGCEFARAIFFTDRDIDIRPIETVAIDPIRTLQQYSEFVMKRLLRYIDTDYALLVQWDGYVVNPGAWSEQFLLYDYIGARWPHQALGIPSAHAVGNGGFSLRSRALLQALQDPRIASSHPEDAAICRTWRDYLEREHGIAFATDAVADRFSFEHIEPAAPTFGFHGQINIERFVDDTALRLLQY